MNVNIGSKWPAAAVIPALRVYMNAVVVKKHIADDNGSIKVTDHLNMEGGSCWRIKNYWTVTTRIGWVPSVDHY